MVSVTSASRFITSAPHYHPRYQSRSSMYIRGLIPRNFAELAEAVPIASKGLGKAEPLDTRVCNQSLILLFLDQSIWSRCSNVMGD